MLACEGLSFAYSKAAPVLRGVSLSLLSGRVTALVGPNGSGKSTLLRLLAGLAKADRSVGGGTVTLDGEALRGLSPPARAARVALLRQRPEVSFGYTVGEVVRFGLVSRGRAASGEACDRIVSRVLERVGLVGRAGERFEHLSVGQQQRAALARALAQLDGSSGGVLLADEPVSAMDPRHAIESLGLLRELSREGCGVLVVLHDLNQALRFADEAAVLDDRGRITASGRAGEVLIPGVLEPVFRVGFSAIEASAGRPAMLIPTVPIGS